MRTSISDKIQQWHLVTIVVESRVNAKIIIIKSIEGQRKTRPTVNYFWRDCSGCGDTMHRQSFPYGRISCCAPRRISDIYRRVRDSTRSRFRSGFLPARDRLMVRRDGEKSYNERTTRQQRTVPVLYSARKPASEDTIAIKSPVLSRARLSSRMSGGELFPADDTF